MQAIYGRKSGEKFLNRQFTEEHPKEITDKYTQRFSTIPAVREMQIKTTLRNHLSPGKNS